ncbi:MAG: DUF4864 domain-containing protein [Pseudomonadota bacterium]
MRALLIFLVLALGTVSAAKAQDDPLSEVIQSQIDAFLADDFATAFTFASPMIQGMFGTSENFGMMVRRGYPMVHRPGRIAYLDQRVEEGASYQTVEIIDQSGRAHYLEYEMVQTPSGWQINGVRFVAPPSVGA